jgi:hypothetical protein
LSKVGQARARIKGVEKEAVDSKDDMMPSLAKVFYKVQRGKKLRVFSNGKKCIQF